MEEFQTESPKATPYASQWAISQFSICRARPVVAGVLRNLPAVLELQVFEREVFERIFKIVPARDEYRPHDGIPSVDVFGGFARARKIVERFGGLVEPKFPLLREREFRVDYLVVGRLAESERLGVLSVDPVVQDDDAGLSVAARNDFFNLYSGAVPREVEVYIRPLEFFGREGGQSGDVLVAHNHVALRRALGGFARLRGKDARAERPQEVVAVRVACDFRAPAVDEQGEYRNVRVDFRL